MLIYQLFMLVSLSFVKKAKRANFLNFCKQILSLCIVSLNSCVRVYIRAYECACAHTCMRLYACVLRACALCACGLSYDLSHFKSLFYNSLIFNHLQKTFKFRCIFLH
nr:MAG TPA: hypothetical protein [Caudoviricetes sp.]